MYVCIWNMEENKNAKQKLEKKRKKKKKKEMKKRDTTGRKIKRCVFVGVFLCVKNGTKLLKEKLKRKEKKRKRERTVKEKIQHEEKLKRKQKHRRNFEERKRKKRNEGMLSKKMTEKDAIGRKIKGAQKEKKCIGNKREEYMTTAKEKKNTDKLKNKQT